jgi:NAD(P)-dependent dehydrogenase (short-subunit alcohol dehydrogenase family)
MDYDLTGKTAVVTGGGKGYGRGIARVLKKCGANVWITGREQKALEKTSKEIGGEYIRADVCVPEDWDRVFASVVEKQGRLDVLVNNAGSGVRIKPLDEQTDEEITESISVNLTASLLGCRRAVPIMKRQKSGTIINVSSVCARQAWPGWSVYSAAKAGIVQFSNCLYTELREWGIRVTSLIPSWGATGFLESAGLPRFDAETSARSIQPEELGDIVAMICALPPHLEIQDMTVWPRVQKVEPL